MTDAEKLEALCKYVEEMSPVFRPAILRTPEEEIENHGWDEACRYHQYFLMEILNGRDTS